MNNTLSHGPRTHANTWTEREAMPAHDATPPHAGDPNAAHVAGWYADKTDQILEKYGPGPRVHFHTGLFETRDALSPGAERDTAQIQRALHRSQERLLERAAQSWNAARTLSGRVLDVGCGLGGGALFWASEYGAQVTGLSNVPRHLAIATDLAERAGVAHRTRFVHGDAHAVPDGLFDTAVAIESSVYFDRFAWFRALRHTVARGGHVLIGDTMSDAPEATTDFNRYWMCRVGSVKEYRAAAQSAGFEPVSWADLSLASARFWRTSAQWISQRLRSEPDAELSAQRTRSLRWHERLAREYEVGTLQNLLLAFRLP